MTATRVTVWILAGMLCALSLSAPAHASHYFWEDVDLVSPTVAAELKALGIDDTETLLVRALAAKDRKAIDDAVSLSADELDQLVRVIELMQIDGVGPKAARLLRAAGVSSVKALSDQDPSALLDQIVAANAKVRYTDVNPDLIVVEDWVQRAKDAQHHVQ